jgi:hypothetical protein
MNNNSKKDSNDFNKGNILIILLLVLFSSKVWDLIWDISKSILWIIIILYGLNYFNPTLGVKLKSIITDLIGTGTENKFIKDLLSNISKHILDILKSKEQNQNLEHEDKQPEKLKSTTLVSSDGESWVVNRQMDPINATGNRKLN